MFGVYSNASPKIVSIPMPDEFLDEVCAHAAHSVLKLDSFEENKNIKKAFG